jgi:uncharacterized protein (DUF58 family)
MEDAAEIQYRVPWRAMSCHAGSHRSMQRGSGYEVHKNAPFHIAGDPRRLDLRASMRDPFGQVQVRIYRQRSIVPVIVLADVSASMSFVGRVSKLELLRNFVNALAYSAFRVGDPFAFTACDNVVRDEISLPLTRSGGAGPLISEQLRNWTPAGSNAHGLLAGAERIAGARALVFLVSDYYLPVDLLRKVLGLLCRHAIIPVVLVDSAEGRLPGVGVAHLLDPETRAGRTLLLRPSLAKRLEENFRKHHDELGKCLAEFDLRPLHVVDKFNSEDVNRYFNE